MIEQLRITGTVIAILEWPHGNLIIPGCNLITDDGDIYYAQKSVGETPTDDFTAGGLRLGTSSTTPTKSDIDVTTFGTDGDIAESSGYPKTNDSDAANTGAGTDRVTWKFEYGVNDGNITGIKEGAIVDNLTTPTAALSHFLFASSFDKTSAASLTIYVNHRMNGE